jgi:protein phosphatase
MEETVRDSFGPPVAALSDTGRVRGHNEDYVGYYVPQGEALLSQGALFLVCDGVGGAAQGEVASQRAVTTILDSYYNLPTDAPPAARLVAAIRRANTAVYQGNLGQPEERYMATTVVAALVIQSMLIVVHAGDSRAYMVRGGRAYRLTEDHSLVAKMVQAGEITPEEAENHPWRNRILRSLGPSETVKLEPQSFSLLPGDRIVLCSDGLTRYVSDAELGEMVSVYPAQRAARHLIDLANGRGGKDNISVIIADPFALKPQASP